MYWIGGQTTRHVAPEVVCHELVLQPVSPKTHNVTALHRRVSIVVSWSLHTDTLRRLGLNPNMESFMALESLGALCFWIANVCLKIVLNITMFDVSIYYSSGFLNAEDLRLQLVGRFENWERLSKFLGANTEVSAFFAERLLQAVHSSYPCCCLTSAKTLHTFSWLEYLTSLRSINCKCFKLFFVC